MPICIDSAIVEPPGPDCLQIEGGTEYADPAHVQVERCVEARAGELWRKKRRRERDNSHSCFYFLDQLEIYRSANIVRSQLILVNMPLLPNV